MYRIQLIAVTIMYYAVSTSSWSVTERGDRYTGDSNLKAPAREYACILNAWSYFLARMETPRNAPSRNLVNDTVQKVSCACETRTVTQA